MNLPISFAKIAILVALALLALAYIVYWAYSIKRVDTTQIRPTFSQMLIGFITDFLDTLGIGSFAITTAFYRLTRSVDDEKIPGTLNIGHTLPTILQAFIFISVIEIDLTTLVLLICSAVAGAYWGAALVSRLPKQSIQFGMGVALLIAAGLILAKQLQWIPSGGESLSLSGPLLIVGILCNFIFGSLMTIGVGAYAPIMIMVSLLGMNQKAAFPLMMGSCAFLMPVASMRFLKSGRYDVRAALGLAIFGLPGVAIAAWIVKELPLYYVAWLVLVVVIYTAATMLYSAMKSKSESPKLEQAVLDPDALDRRQQDPNPYRS